MTSNRFDLFAIISALTLVFLLPIFFVPILSVPLQDTKLFLLIFGVILTALFWGIARLKSNGITIPESLIFIPILLLPIITLTSSFFSGNLLNSIIGQGFAIDTVLMISVLATSFFIGALLFTSKDKIIKFYLVLTASTLIFFLYQLIRLFFGSDFLSFNMFFGNTANTLGKWNDVAIFSGLITLLSLTTLNMLRPKGLLKIIFYTSLIVSLFMLVIVNFKIVWLILAGITFLLSIHIFFKDKIYALQSKKERLADYSKSEDNRISGLTLLVLTISILFIFAGSFFGTFISSQLNIFQVEARPSWQSTFKIMQNVYANNILFGSGPNNFTKEWLLNKPNGINQSPFWDVDFSFGVGTIPTFFITNGILSVITWIAFFILFLWGGIRMFLYSQKNVFNGYFATSSFFSALFLWLVSIFYIPHVILFFFAFLFSGIFVAVQIQTGCIKQKIIAFDKNPKSGIVGVILLFAFIILLVAGLYVSTTKFASAVYIKHAGVIANTEGNLDKAEKNINRALILNKDDRIYRAASQITVLQFTKLVNQGKNTPKAQQKFQTMLTSAIKYGRNAILVDDKNYENWVSLARIYEGLILLKVDGAYNNTKAAYERAILLNPKNPRLMVDLARVEALKGNNVKAREYIADALRIKDDYTNAIFLLSQIEINEGNVEEAISSVETITLFSPNNPLAFFQLGLLKYSDKDYSGAIKALERAVALNNQYANARYFLGLSYYKIGQLNNSINQFVFISKLNPGNKEVNIIIENLTAGRAPFNNIASPTDPLKGEKLPIEE